MRSWVVPGYVEDRVLGNGASGRVVAAVHEASGWPVAIKYLAARLLRDPRFRADFRDAAELLKSLDVPEVVRVYDYVEAPGRGAAIVMELVNGVSLYQMIKHQGRVGPETALSLLRGSLLGLASAHALGIVHRDYKPENVLVDDEGITKLVDFGVAVKAGRRAPGAGTPLYMAPEQWAGGPPTSESDIYAATAVFFECLTGTPPFTGGMAQLALQHQTAPVPVEQVDEPLRALIAWGMAKEPWDRPVNAREFLRELEYTAAATYGPFWDEHGRSQLTERAVALLSLSGAGAGGGSGQALATTALGDAGRRRKILLAAAALGAIAVLAVAGTVYALQGPGSGSPAPSPAGSSSSVAPPTSPAGGQTPTTTGMPSPRPGSSSPHTGPPPASAVPPATGTPPTTSPAARTPATTSSARPTPPATHPATRPPTTARTTPVVPPPKSTTPSPPPTSAPTTTPPTSAPGDTPSGAPASSAPTVP